MIIRQDTEAKCFLCKKCAAVRKRIEYGESLTVDTKEMKKTLLAVMDMCGKMLAYVRKVEEQDDWYGR